MTEEEYMDFSSAEPIKKMFKMASYVGGSTAITPMTQPCFDIGAEKENGYLKLTTVDSTHVCLLIQSTVGRPSNIHPWASWKHFNETTTVGDTFHADPNEIQKSIHRGEASVHIRIPDDDTRLITIKNGRATTTIRSMEGVEVPKDLNIVCEATHYLDRVVLLEGLERITAFNSNRFNFEVCKDGELYISSVGQHQEPNRSFRLERVAESLYEDGYPDQEYVEAHPEETWDISPEYKTDKLAVLQRILNSTTSEMVAISYSKNKPLFVESSLEVNNRPFDYDGAWMAGCSWRFILAPMVKEN